MARGNKGKTLLCAIYTRKSSEEGLEQDFNSLHAQREACEAYIASQRHEGWSVVETAYDDGGISGGTMERPALKRLLEDIENGKVNVVVVYKVDRLTRALSDFARMVDIFDEHHVSFVSVTQQFNTTSSMGRLTLNVLLSFAQFEREVTGERIRDKIAASKKKGMWMGGHVPLGYDARDRKLVANTAEAATVLHIFGRYLALGCVRKLKAELDRDGRVSKARTSRAGRKSGGMAFSRGALYRVLQNPVYIGQTRHKEQTYPGGHDAIMDRALWDRVQATLEGNRRARRNGSNAKEPSLLCGLLFDDHGNRFTPSHAVKAGRRYRYYVERSLITEGKAKSDGARATCRRIPAREIEVIIVDALISFLGAPDCLIEAASLSGMPAAAVDRAIGKARGVQAELAAGTPAQHRNVVTKLIGRIILEQEAITIEIRKADLGTLLGIDQRDYDDGVHRLRISTTLRRRGSELRLVIGGDDGEPASKPDPTLIKAIVRGHDWLGRITRGEAANVTEIARAEALTSSYVIRILRLAFLAPDITEAILQGHQPAGLTTERLIRTASIPVTWPDQRAFLGFKTG